MFYTFPGAAYFINANSIKTHFAGYIIEITSRYYYPGHGTEERAFLRNLYT